MLRASAVLVACSLIACGGGANDDDRTGQVDGRTITAIAIGDSSTCTLTARGFVECDGRIVADDGAAISVGHDHLCVVRRNGRVACLGENKHGQLGDGTTAARDQLVDLALADVAGVTAGFNRTCAWTKSGDAYCWGAMEFDPHRGIDAPRDATTPVQLQLVHVKSIALGGFHACALIENGSVQCWGSNYFGQLGLGDEIEREIPTPTSVAGAIAISTGTHHSCAILHDGKVQCWGADIVGQLGEASDGFEAGKHRNFPTTIPTLRRARALIAASDHTCVLLEGRTAPRCWGYNDMGQVSPGLPHIVRPATIPAGIDDVAVIGSGANRTCAVREDGAFKCWGN
jgi:alpha-tubulin suppressor-like RCC1 family protein